jgi:hypothetical protein
MDTAGTTQPDLFEQAQGGDTPSAASDISVAHRMPNEACHERCQAAAVTQEDDTDSAVRWITCELGLALAKADMPEVLTIMRKIREAQNGASEENSPKCPVQIHAEGLIAFISAQIATALSSGQVPEDFRPPTRLEED